MLLSLGLVPVLIVSVCAFLSGELTSFSYVFSSLLICCLFSLCFGCFTTLIYITWE